MSQMLAAPAAAERVSQFSPLAESIAAIRTNGGYKTCEPPPLSAGSIRRVEIGGSTGSFSALGPLTFGSLVCNSTPDTSSRSSHLASNRSSVTQPTPSPGRPQATDMRPPLDGGRTQSSEHLVDAGEAVPRPVRASPATRATMDHPRGKGNPSSSPSASLRNSKVAAPSNINADRGNSGRLTPSSGRATPVPSRARGAAPRGSMGRGGGTRTNPQSKPDAPLVDVRVGSSTAPVPSVGAVRHSTVQAAPTAQSAACPPRGNARATQAADAPRSRSPSTSSRAGSVSTRSNVAPQRPRARPPPSSRTSSSERQEVAARRQTSRPPSRPASPRSSTRNTASRAGSPARNSTPSKNPSATVGSTAARRTAPRHGSPQQKGRASLEGGKTSGTPQAEFGAQNRPTTPTPHVKSSMTPSSSPNAREGRMHSASNGRGLQRRTLGPSATTQRRQGPARQRLARHSTGHATGGKPSEEFAGDGRPLVVKMLHEVTAPSGIGGCHDPSHLSEVIETVSMNSTQYAASSAWEDPYSDTISVDSSQPKTSAERYLRLDASSPGCPQDPQNQGGLNRFKNVGHYPYPEPEIFQRTMNASIENELLSAEAAEIARRESQRLETVSNDLTEIESQLRKVEDERLDLLLRTTAEMLAVEASATDEYQRYVGGFKQERRALLDAKWENMLKVLDQGIDSMTDAVDNDTLVHDAFDPTALPENPDENVRTPEPKPSPAILHDKWLIESTASPGTTRQADAGRNLLFAALIFSMPSVHETAEISGKSSEECETELDTGF